MHAALVVKIGSWTLTNDYVSLHSVHDDDEDTGDFGGGDAADHEEDNAYW